MSKNPPLYAWDNYHCTQTTSADALSSELVSCGFSAMPLKAVDSRSFTIETTTTPTFDTSVLGARGFVGLKAYERRDVGGTYYEQATISGQVMATISIVTIPNPFNAEIMSLKVLTHSNLNYTYSYSSSNEIEINFIREGPVAASYSDTLYLQATTKTAGRSYKLLASGNKHILESKTTSVTFTKSSSSYSTQFTWDDANATDLRTISISGQQFTSYAASATGNQITITAMNPVSSTASTIVDTISICCECDTSSLLISGHTYYNQGVEIVYLHNGLYRTGNNDFFASACLNTSTNTDMTGRDAKWSDDVKPTQQYPFFSNRKFRIEGQVDPVLRNTTQKNYKSLSVMTTNGQTVTQPQQLLFDTRQVIRDDTYDWNNRPEDNQTLKIIDDYLYINGVKTYYLNGHNVYIGVLVNTLFSDGGSEPLTLHKSFRTKYVSDSDISSDLGFGIEYGYLPNEGAVMPTKGVTTLYASPLSADANRTRQYHFAESAYYSWKLKPNLAITLSLTNDNITGSTALEKIDSLWVKGTQYSTSIQCLPSDAPVRQIASYTSTYSYETQGDIVWNSNNGSTYNAFAESKVWSKPAVVGVTITNVMHFSNILDSRVSYNPPIITASGTSEFIVSADTTAPQGYSFFWTSSFNYNSNLPIPDCYYLKDSGYINTNADVTLEHKTPGISIINYNASAVFHNASTPPKYLYAIMIAP